MSQPSRYAVSERPDQEDIARLVDEAERRNVRFVNLEFTDVVGMAKCVTIPVEQFPDCLTHGKWFDGSALESFARVAESDMYLYPDLETFSVMPVKIRPPASVNRTDLDFVNEDEVGARVICNVLTPSGERFDGDPRATLVRAMDHA